MRATCCRRTVRSASWPPPYAVTSDLVRRLLVPGSRLVDARLVLQRAAAGRPAAGRASGAFRWERHWELVVGRGVPRAAFRPPSRIDSVVLVRGDGTLQDSWDLSRARPWLRAKST